MRLGWVTFWYGLAAVMLALAWLFSTNDYVAMGEGEFCDLDSPEQIRVLALLAAPGLVLGTALWLRARHRLSRRTHSTLLLVAVLLTTLTTVRWAQGVAAAERQTALGCRE